MSMSLVMERINLGFGTTLGMLMHSGTALISSGWTSMSYVLQTSVGGNGNKLDWSAFNGLINELHPIDRLIFDNTFTWSNLRQFPI